VTYLLAVLPVIGVYLGMAILSFGIRSVFQGSNSSLGAIISLPIVLAGLAGIMYLGLAAGVKITRYHYENLTIEGKRCQYHGTVGGILSALWLDYIIMFCTFGFYFPWFVTKTNKYTYSQIDVQGERLEFHGDPSSLLGTWIVGALLTTITFGIYFPWYLNSLYEWRWNATTINGRPFRFNKDPGGLFGVWILNAILSVCTLYIYIPWAICKQWQWECDHVS
jgi:uncharacterized membrane protein YjgN (DUF898 family)